MLSAAHSSQPAVLFYLYHAETELNQKSTSDNPSIIHHSQHFFPRFRNRLEVSPFYINSNLSLGSCTLLKYEFQSVNSKTNQLTVLKRQSSAIVLEAAKCALYWVGLFGLVVYVWTS